MATILVNGKTISYTDKGLQYTKMVKNTRVTMRMDLSMEKAPVSSAMEELILENSSWTNSMDTVSQITLKNQPIYHVVNDFSRLSIDHP